MLYDEKSFIDYHLRGDAGVECSLNAKICKALGLSDYEKFRYLYFYSMTYNVDSALDMLHGERDIKNLKFRTDRRYVRCNGAYPKLLAGLNEGKLQELRSCSGTQGLYDTCRRWFFFGRYAAFLILENYMETFRPHVVNDLKMGWEPDENYTKGAELVTGTDDRRELDKFLSRCISATGSNEFSLETSLCAVEKIRKGTRWDGYYTERLIDEMNGSKYKNLVMGLL